MLNLLMQFLNWFFALDSVQAWWYITRAAGLVGYLLLWLSTAWGLAVPSKIIDPVLKRTFTFDFHQVISLLSIGFIFLHLIVLLFDHYLPFSIAQVLVPFTSSYRPLWVGMGVIAFYLILLVTVTFYLRGRIGTRAFRAIHVLSLVGYLGTTLHGLYAGTDSPLLSVGLMYRVSFLSVLFLTVFWLVNLLMERRGKRMVNGLADSKRI
jgi:predicted ferric reductase